MQKLNVERIRASAEALIADYLKSTEILSGVAAVPTAEQGLLDALAVALQRHYGERIAYDIFEKRAALLLEQGSLAATYNDPVSNRLDASRREKQ